MRFKTVLAATAIALLASACSRTQAPVTYEMQTVVKGGSKFHGVHGLRFDKDDTLYAVSVIGQSRFKVNTKTGQVETVQAPPEGMADDLAFGPDGTVVWTAIEDGILYAQSPGGPVRKLWEGQRGLNAVSFTRDGKRLFVTLVFYGDALYEIDLAGAKPPRLVVDKPGGLNAFEIGDDGMIYGPLVFGHRIVKVNPDTGAMTTITDEVKDPGALKLDFKGSAYALNNDTELWKIDLKTGKAALFATLPAGADNLALNAAGNIFVSLSETNAIVEVDAQTAAIRYVVEPAPLTSATGLSVQTQDGKDAVYLGDLFGGVKKIDAATGAIEKTPVNIFQAAHVSTTNDHMVVVGQVFGVMQRVDRKTFEVLGNWGKFNSPGDALEAPDGTVIVAETGSGRLLRVTGPEVADRQVIAENLQGPLGLAWAGTDAVYVTESTGGRVTRIALADGAATPVAQGLKQPEGIAVDSDGTLLVVEVDAKQIKRINAQSGEVTVIAANLPIGLSNGPSLYRSVAVSPSAIYFNSDVDNSVYKLVARKP
ncbi:MAG: SMP-30/gluconolactonase/LRE family protein [Steroidobacteraceae bacterium]